jgi:hypothetical protein
VLAGVAGGCQALPPTRPPVATGDVRPVEVGAVSDGQAVLWNSSGSRLEAFSLADGKCTTSFTPSFTPIKMVADRTGRGVWGSARAANGDTLLWSWEPPKSEKTTATPDCQTIFSVHEGSKGERYALCSATSSPSDPARLITWLPGGALDQNKKMPPPWGGSGPEMSGAEAPFGGHGSYAIDPCGGEAALQDLRALPSLPVGGGWVETFVKCGTWLLADEELKSAWLTQDNGQTWSKRRAPSAEKGDVLSLYQGSQKTLRRCSPSFAEPALRIKSY